jgi:cell division septal protein FtsQ
MRHPPHPLELGYRPPSQGRAGSNRKRLAWIRPARRWCMVLLCVELVVLFLFYPAFWVRNLRIEGLHSLSTGQVLAAAQVPERTNIVLMMLHVPLVRRVEMLPGVDHASCAAVSPNGIVLRIAERTPYAVLNTGGNYWLVDRKRVPYQCVAGPVAGLPTIQPTGTAASDSVQAGQQIASDWMVQAYYLLSLLSNNETLQPKLITVDQNANLCLNRLDNLRINIGTPDDLPAKLAVADATLAASGPDIASKVAYIDVTFPSQPALGLRVPAHGSGRT